MFGKTSQLSPLELRKQLLIAESELNRAHLSAEWRRIAHGARNLAHRAKTITTVASSATLILAGFDAFRGGNAADAEGKSSWFHRILRGAQLAHSIWLAFCGKSE